MTANTPATLAPDARRPLLTPGRALIALALRADWRARYGFAVGLLAIVALTSTVLAAGAGEQLLAHQRERDALIHDHQEAADTLRLLMFALTGVLLLTLARDWRRARGGGVIGGRAASAALAIVTIALSGATGFFVVRTGHLGAKATWQQEGGGEGD